MEWDDIFRDFVYLWAVIDPIGSIPVFIAVTAGTSRMVQRKIAYQAIITAGLVLLLFIVGGQIMLDLLEIPLAAFQIAGGLVLFLFALTMIFGDSKPEAEIEESTHINAHQNKAVFPLAIPSIASPGAMMAVVLITDNHRFHIGQQLISTLTMMTVLLITLGFLLLAGRIQKLIGDAGASVVSRIGGLILASVAVDSVLSGIKTSLFFKLLADVIFNLTAWDWDPSRRPRHQERAQRFLRDGSSVVPNRSGWVQLAGTYCSRRLPFVPASHRIWRV